VLDLLYQESRYFYVGCNTGEVEIDGKSCTSWYLWRTGNWNSYHCCRHSYCNNGCLDTKMVGWLTGDILVSSGYSHSSVSISDLLPSQLIVALKRICPAIISSTTERPNRMQFFCVCGGWHVCWSNLRHISLMEIKTYSMSLLYLQPLLFLLRSKINHKD